MHKNHCNITYILFSLVRCVRNLGICLDSDVMRTHVSKTVAIGFAALRQIRSVQRPVSRQTSAAVNSRVTDIVKAGLRQCRTSGHASLDTC